MSESPYQSPETVADEGLHGTTDASGYQTTPYDTDKMPPGIPYIIGNEAAERFSFYGMKAILAVFLTKYLIDVNGELAPMEEHAANSWVHSFVAAVYFLPIFGAIISDWLFGKYRTILWLSIVYCLGHAVMALVDFPSITGMDPRFVLAVALGLISLGAGGIKPCVSAHVGDQFGPKNKHFISRVYSWFYFSINLGSTISTLLTPWLLYKYGPGVAFGVPGVLMGLATLAFWMGRDKFVHVPAGGSHFFNEVFSWVGLKALLNLIPLFVLLAPFWALFDQTASSWVHQAGDLNCKVFGYEVLPSQIQAANPILVMLFIPLFNFVVYPTIGKYWTITPLRKIGMGLLLTAPAFALIAWIQMRIDAGETPHLIWQIFGYVIITAAEVMVSITALEFSYTQAPKKMKSLIMGVYLLSVSLGNVFTSSVNGVITAYKAGGVDILVGANYFWFFTIVMLVNAVVFVVFSQFYFGQTYIQGDDS